jgi:dipeptidyl aminopeptidase/acylaminoacyl peptidase
MIALSQAREYYRALLHYNVPTEMVVYPREGHGLREPVHRKRAYERILAWYDRYVASNGPAAPSISAGALDNSNKSRR